jgi:hypothetical protein
MTAQIPHYAVLQDHVPVGFLYLDNDGHLLVTFHLNGRNKQPVHPGRFNSVETSGAKRRHEPHADLVAELVEWREDLQQLVALREAQQCSSLWYPGADREDVFRTLRDIQSVVQNVGNVHGQAYDRLVAYLEWANNSVRMLEHRLSSADIDHLVLTRGYDRLLAATGTLTSSEIGSQRVLNGW